MKQITMRRHRMLDLMQVIKAGKGLPVNDTDSRLIGEELAKEVYGWHVDPSISDPAQAVTYLTDAVGKTPAAMGASGFSYGSWKNAFFMPRPCMLRSDGTVAYYLDPNDYTRKADGTASDVSNADFDGNAMMEWPLIFYKFESGEAEGEGYFYCSNKQIDSSYKCWCNVNANNEIIPHFYTAIYNGTGTSRLRSLSGVRLTQANGSGYTTAEQEITRALSNNTTEDVQWYTDIFSDRILINALLVLMGKSLSVSNVFGKGVGAGSSLIPENYVTGAMNDKGLFFGTFTGNNAVKVFGMENWYGLMWRRTAGIMTDTNDLTYYKFTYGTADGSTVIGYSEQGTGYLTASSSSATGWVTKIDYSNGLPIPKSVTGGITQDYSGSYYGCYYYNKPSASTGSGLMTRALFGGAYDPNSSRKSIAHTATLNMDSSNNGAFNVTTGLSCKPI